MNLWWVQLYDLLLFFLPLCYLFHKQFTEFISFPLLHTRLSNSIYFPRAINKKMILVFPFLVLCVLFYFLLFFCWLFNKIFFYFFHKIQFHFLPSLNIYEDFPFWFIFWLLLLTNWIPHQMRNEKNKNYK